ncbi:MAG: EamA family transporter [Bacteroidia bacterium]
MIYLILSIFLFAVNNILWSYFSQNNPPILLIARRAIFTSLLFVALLLILKINITEDLTLQGLFKIIIICSCGFTGLICLIKGFSIGNLSQYSIYSLLMTVVFAIIKPNEKTNLDFWLPLIIAGIGFLYFIWNQFQEVSFGKSIKKPHGFFLLAHVFFGLSMYLQYDFLLDKSTSSLTVASFQEFFILILASLLVFFQKNTISKNVKVSLKTWHYFIMSIPISFAIIMGLEGLRRTAPFDASLIGLYTPISTVALGSILGIDRFEWKSLIGVVIMTIGVVLIYY